MSVLEPQDRVLGERAVIDGKAPLVLGQVGQRRVGLGQQGLRVPPDQVALGERAPRAVLAAQADRDTFQEEGAEGEGLRECPVHRAVLGQTGGLLVNDPLQLGVDVETRAESP